MHEGKFYRMQAPQLLGDQSPILEKISANLPVNLISAFVIPFGIKANVQCKGGTVTVWSELKTVRIETVWTSTDDGVRYPLFKKRVENSPPEHDAAYEFDPLQAMMRIFFTSNYRFASGNYEWESSFLLAKAPKRKEIFRPPLPNTHTDSRICMGEYHYSGPCLADAFANAVGHFGSSRWNSDLATGLTPAVCKALYSFKDNKQIAMPKEFKWWEIPGCAPVNNITFGELPLV